MVEVPMVGVRAGVVVLVVAVLVVVVGNAKVVEQLSMLR